MKKAVLVILDGWGLAPAGPGNAISLANTPVVDRLMKDCPNTTLLTSGEDVGLPEGQMGNSEVGHLNIGAGRIVWQELANINKAIREKTFDTQPVLVKAFEAAKKNNSKLHFIGLVSDGGVHSHINHLKQLCTIANNYGLDKVFIHAFTDGRDTDPKSGLGFLNDLQNHLDHSKGKIASVTGRYYAMDRDKRWERVKIAYDALTAGIGEKATSWKSALEASYAANVTDEFIKPIIVTNNQGNAIGNIEANDIVICFNFRTDRCREITIALTQKDMPEHGMHTMPLHYVTMTRYDDTYKGIEVVYEKNNLSLTMGEVLENAGKKQIRIAETEKYPHVTFFFSGGREQPFNGETRLMAPSPKVATYDLQPEMSAEDIKNLIVPELKKGEVDFVCLNFANADMVGHTGVISAAVKAVETVDRCLGEVLEAGKEHGYNFIIIADHGNADMMLNEDGSPNTAHTTNPVPCILVSDNKALKISSGRLADVAPSLLYLLGIQPPAEMTGQNLIA
ncbi:MAG TPA: 2,3-bisphosphoglycerate-independent phosphoglycerate mutase [Bacteroidia bacterium]|jgi:2,3-bisphosphoglycerate-independent phosphoglycerate mutase|nr:2,3-bisphosphoglycerate-independent phosphoglycerate mutase [Bacteroidia bacterium]HQF28197.1 2,3-bisphosphoglycerate-independent phosphoglycerate mutase [Bacteroidia bacterium]HQK98431.1 2,3-bisphosphoglycerate-independent phosphoglycerate mutase [Bacteroidia bacterium]